MSIHVQGYQNKPVNAVSYAVCRRHGDLIESRAGKFHYHVTEGVLSWFRNDGGTVDGHLVCGGDHRKLKRAALKAAKSHVRQAYGFGIFPPIALWLLWNFALPKSVEWIFEWLFSSEKSAEHRAACGGQW